MPDITIEGLTYGYSSEGVTRYLQRLRDEVLLEVQRVVSNIDEVVAVCQNKWAGTACENFIQNFKLDSDHVCEQFNKLYEILSNEMYEAEGAMKYYDDSLIEKR